ncbi:leukotriene B4 receptor 1 [Esox lucius]|uniref:G-protein coupled receptors family 1 profile domain-containing protein n=1 Tax=Esox lucius TaxID=8010 RepID=A0AAY5K4P1_ESOLU|nr:leukotriene B4 receptor 1 [Esox lucius]
MTQNHSINSPQSTRLEPAMDPDLEFSGGTAAASVILGLSFLVGAPGNLLVIWTILRHLKKCSHTVVLILHLAVADLLVLITLPVWIYSLARSWVFGEAFCKATVYVVYSCMYGSVFLITLMSVERVVAVRHPFASVKWRKKGSLNKVLLILWAMALLFSVPVIPTQVVLGDPGEEQCLYRNYTSNVEEAGIVLLETMVGFVGPFFILVVSYSCLCSRIAQMNFKSKRKSTGLIASVVVVFALCWMPHHVGNMLSLIILAIQEYHHEAADRLESFKATMTFIAGALAFISSSVNPLLYVFAARSFRSSLRETGIQKLFRHISSTAPGEGTKELYFMTKKQSSSQMQSISSLCITEPKEQMDVQCENCSS